MPGDGGSRQDHVAAGIPPQLGPRAMGRAAWGTRRGRLAGLQDTEVQTSMFSRFSRRSRAARSGPRVWRGPAGARAYAIGAVHGRLDLLIPLLKEIDRDDAGSAPARTWLILLGDIIDRGPDSRGVVELLMDLPDDLRTVFLMGNHEEMMLRVLGGEPEAVHQWLTFGGYEFAQSYGVEVGRLASL